jgi:hypothetical protein
MRVRHIITVTPAGKNRLPLDAWGVILNYPSSSYREKTTRL